MERFRRLVIEARQGVTPWDALPRDRLDAIAAQLQAEDVADIIAALDALAVEKDAVPDWDGDTWDDIGHVQSEYAVLLSRLADRFRAEVEHGLASPHEQTRMWVRLALDRQAG
jgi:hypothetical protein